MGQFFEKQQFQNTTWSVKQPKEIKNWFNYETVALACQSNFMATTAFPSSRSIMGFVLQTLIC